ncbi:MAG: hydrogenase maturation nickel metallochaperone HypA [Betaproteobacteria bacterium]|nr:hydrogenase maturation nickel metallochaperone HypA [Betaproteobacteria bacterium]
MHEMSLAESVLSLVEETARRENVGMVKTVVLEIGALANVEIEALRFCFEAARRSVTKDAALEIQEIPGQGWCLPCGEAVLLARLGDLCPRCGSGQVQPTMGMEMRVKEIEIE